MLLVPTSAEIVQGDSLAMHSLMFSPVRRVSSDGKKVRVLVKTGEALDK